MPRTSSSTGLSTRLNVSHPGAAAVVATCESPLSATDDAAVVGATGLGAGALDSPPARSTGTAACVTIVRAAPVEGSVRLRVNIPTAATSPSVVCANRRIENEPVTCGLTSASLPGAAGIGVVGGSADGVCGGSDGVVGGSDGVVGGSDVGGGVSGGCGGVGSVGGNGVAGVVNEPVMGMTSLPDLA